MGLLGKLLGATVDVVLTPLEVAKDVFDGDIGAVGETISDRLNKALDKISDAAEDAADGDLL